MPGIQFVNGRCRVELDTSRFEKQFEDAQKWLGDQVLADCRSYLPFDKGTLSQQAYAEEGGRRVIFPMEYARFQYGGKVMVGENSGSPFAQYGEKKILTEKPLEYSKKNNPNATDHWFDAAKASNGEMWRKKVKEIAGGG